MTSEHTGSGDVTRSLELLWDTRERPTRGPRPALELRSIVEAAVALADSNGLAALSMRNVAAELGVGTMTLYRYVPGKAELLDLMVDHVNGPLTDLEKYRREGWRSALESIASNSWKMYVSHSWLLQVNQSRPLLGPNALAGFNFTLEVLQGLGLSDREKVSMLVAVDGFITGLARQHILHLQAAQHSGVTDKEFWERQEPFLDRALETGAYPLVRDLPDDTFNMKDEEIMGFGLRGLLDGFELLIDSRREQAREAATGSATGAATEPVTEEARRR